MKLLWSHFIHSINCVYYIDLLLCDALRYIFAKHVKPTSHLFARSPSIVRINVYITYLTWFIPILRHCANANQFYFPGIGNTCVVRIQEIIIVNCRRLVSRFCTSYPRRWSCYNRQKGWIILGKYGLTVDRGSVFIIQPLFPSRRVQVFNDIEPLCPVAVCVHTNLQEECKFFNHWISIYSSFVCAYKRLRRVQVFNDIEPLCPVAVCP